MGTVTKGRDRVVCVPLSEAEWAALVDKHPDPVEWLRDQVLAQIEGSELPKPHGAVRADEPGRPWSTRRV